MSGNLSQVLGRELDAQNEQGVRDFEAVPPGWYKCLIAETDLVETQKSDGWRLKVDFQIIEGEYQDLHIYEGYNIVNPNQTAQKIATEHLVSIAQAVGVPSVSDTSQIDNQILWVRVVIDKKDKTRNQAKAYKHISEDPYAKPGASQTTAAAAPAWAQQQQQQPPQQAAPPVQQQTAQPPVQAPPAQTSAPVQQQAAPAQGKMPWMK